MEIFQQLGNNLLRLHPDWPHYLLATLLVLTRLSGLVAFAPVFSSAAIAPRIKASFVISMAILLAPVVTVLPGSRAVADVSSVFGELGIGVIFGLSLMFLNEALQFAAVLLGMQFSFSLVNLLDPNSMIETPVLGQLLGWLGILVIVGAGLDRTLIAAIIRSFCIVPLGTAVVHAATGKTLAFMIGGIFLAGLQLASPVLAAALTVEITIALMARMAPSLPATIFSIPVKTLISYVVLISSLAIWPRWIEHHFIALLDSAEKLMAVA